MHKELNLCGLWDKKAFLFAVLLSVLTIAYIPLVFGQITYCTVVSKTLQFSVFYIAAMYYRKLAFKKKEGLFRNEPVYIFVAFLITNLVALISIYPGGWRWDDLYTLHHLMESSIWPTWQHYLTSVFYMVCLLTIPTPSFIVFVQIVIISAISAYIAWRLYVYFDSWLIVVLLVLLSLTPPLLNMNLYPLRAGLHSYLEVLLFFIIVMNYLEKRDWTIISLVQLALLAAVVSVWRSECVVYLVLMPVMLAFLLWRTIPWQRIVLFAFTLLIAGIGLSAFQSQNGESDYALTAYMPSLPVFAHRAIEDDNSELISELEKTYDISVLDRAYRDNTPGIEMYWHQKTWPYLKKPEAERDAEFYGYCRQSFINGVLTYPDSFLDSRVEQFVSLMGWRWSPHFTKDLYSDEGKYFEWFASQETFVLNQPLNLKIRDYVASYIETSSNGFEALSWVYNPLLFIPVYALVIAIAIRKNTKLMVVFAVFFAHHVLTFLSAPTYYFMYYYSFSLMGGMLLCFLVCYYKKIVRSVMVPSK